MHALWLAVQSVSPSGPRLIESVGFLVVSLWLLPFFLPGFHKLHLMFDSGSQHLFPSVPLWSLPDALMLGSCLHVWQNIIDSVGGGLPLMAWVSGWTRHCPSLLRLHPDTYYRQDKL